jgi:hypothetical protein
MSGVGTDRRDGRDGWSEVLPCAKFDGLYQQRMHTMLHKTHLAASQRTLSSKTAYSRHDLQRPG